MSDKNNNLFDDDVLKNLEALKAKYSDNRTDNEPIIKEKKPSAPAAREKAAEAPVKKAPPVKKATPAPKAPAQKAVKPKAPAPKKASEPADRPAAHTKPAPANKPVPKPSAPAGDDLSVFDGLILTDNGRSAFDEKPAAAKKAKNKAPEKSAAAKKENRPVKAENSENKAGKSKKGKKKKSHKLRNALLIVFIAAVLWGALFGIDLVYVSHWQDPIFCKKTAEYENGSKDFVGLFYKVQYHVEDNGDVYTVCLPWFVKGPNKDLEEASANADADEPSKTEVPVNNQIDNAPVDITIPKEYIDIEGDASQLTAEQKANGYISVAVNGDGSVTYQIGKADYEREIENIKSDVAEKLQSLVTDTDFPSIKKVDFNNDFSQVSLYVDKIVYQTGLDSFVNQSVVSWVGFYQSFAKQNPVCDLSILDYTDGSVIEQSKG